ncbi:MAG: amino acid adenylation domain-containing protein [Firmicutes bacterium]|nr:amino acid adenylation domain-containing protein [Bacillota bacterium]
MQTNIFSYLENTAERYPDKTALVDDKGSVSFAALLTAALSIGTAAAAMIPVPEDPPFARPVCVMTGRDADSIKGFMGAMAAGCFYVPVDRTMPKARMEKVFKTVSPALVIGRREDRETAEGLENGAPFLAIEDAEAGDIDADLLSFRRSLVLDVDPAYVFFTSGSTGDPKGIAVSHGNLIDFTEWYCEEFNSSADDVCGNQPPFYFDASGRDLFPCLKTGGTIHILPRKLFMFPALLIRYLNDNRINVLNWATSAFDLVANSRVLEKHQPLYLKRIVLGGEALHARQINLWKKAAPDAEIVNVYGPTETTVDCCFYRVDRTFRDEEPVPIGRACANMQLMVLGEDERPVKKGEAGELCVRGRGVSLGYYGDFGKSAESFVQDPLNPWYHDRVYRTGDMVKQGEDGLLYFLSRRDSQIKHMGYRIELGETETALMSIGGIDRAVCLFDGGRDRIICVYCGSIEKNEAAEKLAALIPRYMCPNEYVRIDRMPETMSGKPDRPALKKRYIDGQGDL